MNLKELLAGVTYSSKAEIDLSSSINNLILDSRKIKSGDVFIALKGVEKNGNDFINSALEKGASFVFSDSIVGDKIIKIEKLREHLGGIIAKFYQEKQPENIVAITGTNGKTSIASFCKQIWEALNIKSATIGTLGVICDDVKFDSSLTTPDIITMHEILAKLVDTGTNHLALEASSHGIMQHRIDGIDIRVAAFTNLTQDHLDYHHDMESYFAAKRKLFTDYLSLEGVAIINADDEYGKRLIEDLEGFQIIDYGRNAKDFKIVEIKEGNFTIQFQKENYSFENSLLGEFQIYNLTCSLAIMHYFGISIRKLQQIIPNLKTAPGRMEEVELKSKKAKIFIDFAHTSKALESSLNSLKIHRKNRLLVLFGCGGNRDIDKRGKMGKVSNMADIVIVTDDNPRHEDPAKIRAAIIKEVPKAIEISDRKKAIEYAVNLMEEGDILLVAGKGHEKYQIIGDQKLPFDDKRIVEGLV